MLAIDEDALYFTFNYSYTLEASYGIDPRQILHIHNDAESRHGDIVLGHGIDPEKFKAGGEQALTYSLLI